MENSSPYHSFRDEGFSVDILVDATLDPDTAESGDAIITLPDGVRYSALLMTIRAIQNVMDADLISGQSLHGAYFHTPDLVVIRDGGIPGMVKVIRDIVTSGDVSLLPTISELGNLIPPEA